MFDGSPATRYAPHPVERKGLVWTQIGGLTIAKISGGLPEQREWRELLDQLRPSVRPLLLWIRGRVWIGSEGRKELAQAIGSSRVALVVDDDLGRGLATALRWLGVKTYAYSMSELDSLETEFELPPGISERMLEQVR